MSRAQAVIDLDAIAANVGTLRAAAAGSQLMAVVKADAYGHGVDRVAPAARAAGADWLGVALPAEAVALRRRGDTGRLMAWLFAPGDDVSEAVALDVDLSASAPWAVTEISNAAKLSGRVARLHLKIDTGLGRGGATPRQWGELLDSALLAESAGLVRIVGIWSHLACADELDQVVTHQQREVFEEALTQARAKGVRPEVRHLASSGATLQSPDTHYDMVRCGIAVYGLSPGEPMGSHADWGLRPAMRVTAEVAHTKRVPAGHGVSYGLRYRTPAESTLALVPVGYADGIPRHGSAALPVSIGGRRHTAAGTIAMDQFVVDVGDEPTAAGDSVVLFGAGEDGTPTADDWARACGTINYEIVTRLGGRIPRSYLGGPDAAT